MKKFSKKNFITWLLGINLLVPIVVLAQEATKLENPLGGTATNPQELFARFAGGLFPFTVILVLFWLVLGGYSVITAMGNSEKYEQGKKMLIYPIVGLLIVVASYAILSTTLNILGGQGGPASFKNSFTLVDPLNLPTNIQICQKVAGVPEDKLYQRCTTDNDCGTGTTKSCQAVMGGAVFYGQRVLGFLVQGLGALTLLIFIYGGFLWFTSAGNEERLTKAKKTLGYAILGLIVVLSSYAAVSFIYSNYESLLTTGTESNVSLPKVIALSPDQRVACFRKPVNGLGITNVANPIVDYGAECSIETVKDCIKPKKDGAVEYQAGEPDGSSENCSDIGACLQRSPGTSYRNRVKRDDCTEKLFGALKKNTQGECPPNTYNIDNSCYAGIEKFEAGQDLPTAGWTCWRQEVGKNYGAVCTTEGAKNCAKPTSDGKYQAGKIDQSFINCDIIGACLQELPGTSYRNRVSEKDCLIENFKYISKTLSGGVCPFANTETIETTNQAGFSCHAKVQFVPGKDLPYITNTSACLRQEGSTNTLCSEETQESCKNFIMGGSTAGTFYPLFTAEESASDKCEVFGYCKQHFPGSSSCKIGVTREKCSEALFQPIGLPTPPWGCAPYKEIAGKCYIPINPIKDFVSFKTMTDGSKILCE